MFYRSFRRRIRKAIVFIFFVYCVIYLVNSVLKNAEMTDRMTIPGPETLCPANQDQTAAIQQNIFFLETSGEECLTARQLCAVESAARSNPFAFITVHMEEKKIKIDPNSSRPHLGLPGQRRNCALMSQLADNTNNLKFVREDLIEHTRGTPLWQLHEKGLLDQSIYPITHRSDAVRVAILWRRGGIYLDLDCIVLRPLHCLENTIGLIDFIQDWVENGVMAFDKEHKFLHFLMKYMVFAFKPTEYISLGPATVTDALKYFCERNDLPADVSLSCRNSSIILQPPRAFYAISNQRQNAFYYPEMDLLDLNELRFSFLSHVYNAGHGTRVDSNSLYANLANAYCPTSYQFALAEGEF